jgi:hypothetical protein
MSVVAALAEEHRLFERLILRLRQACELPPAQCHLILRQTLQVLLPALLSHDAVEELVFRPAHAKDHDQRRALAIVDAQHANLRQLRLEMEELLDGEPRESLPRLRKLVGALAEQLEWHLRTEEMLLWPSCAKQASRSIAAALERKARRGVTELARAIDRLQIAVMWPAEAG